MKFGKYAKYYSIGTQGIFSMVLFLVIGYYIGYKIDKDSPWPAILAVIGMLIGLFIFISYLLYLLKEVEKEKKNEKSKS